MFKKDCNKRVRGCSDFNIESKIGSFIFPDRQVSVSLIPEVTVIQEQNSLTSSLIPDIRIKKLAPDRCIEHCKLRI